MIRQLLPLLVCGSAIGAEGRPLGSVLDDLRHDGLRVVSSDALVDGVVCAAEPAGASPRARLDAALTGTDLRAVAGPGGTWLIVADPPKKGAAAKPVVVSQVLVVSDKIEDVSSLDAWKASFIKPGMSDKDKALAVWTTVLKFRHQEPPPNEFLEQMTNVHDPIKTFNVYGYGMCCCASADIEALARYAGLEARGRTINNHSVPEVKFDGEWHLLDASLLTYFPKQDGKIASVDEIAESIDQWNAAHGGPLPDDKLNAMMRDNGWKNGPDVLSRCPFYDSNGWLPAATHGWSSTMHEYQDKAKHGFYEYGSACGYRLNVELRPGERIVREWANHGLHVNQREGDGPGCMKDKVGKEDMTYAAKYGDIAPGRVGNGTHDWQVPLEAATLAKIALTCENLGDAGGGLAASDAAKPGVLVVRVPSSYVFLAGAAAIDAAPVAGGSIAVELSDDNGTSWKPVGTLDKAGAQSLKLDDLIFRRYDYRLRLTLSGKGTAVKSLALHHDIQHSQRALPALGEGENTISFSSGDEGTVTVFGCTNPDNAGKNVGFAAFHPTLEKVDPNGLHMAEGTGSVTVPVATPGDMKRVRIGAHYRARDAADGYDVKVSFDDGKTWKTVGRLAGPIAGNSLLLATEAPKGARAATVRLDGQQRNTTCCFDLRIDADYVEPAGAAAPVQVTYVWEENGQEKRDVHVTKPGKDTWKIAVHGKPKLKDLVVELAP